MKSKESFSNEDGGYKEEYSETSEVLLTPMSEDIIYDNKIIELKVYEKLTPIGHPNPMVGSYYNCHGWTLGYKEWINVKHKRNSDLTLENQIKESCSEKGVIKDDIFTKELSTYANTNNKNIKKVQKDRL
jgi:hypothetical protein